METSWPEGSWSQGPRPEESEPRADVEQEPAPHTFFHVRFARTGPKEDGYDPEEVDDFLTECDAELRRSERHPEHRPRLGSEDVRTRSFTSRRGGYVPHEVDAALDEAESRLGDAEALADQRRHGRSRQTRRAEDVAALVMGRLQRPDGERFRAPATRKTMGYFARDVDVLCRDLMDYFRSTSRMDTGILRDVVFRTSHGEGTYDEVQVDAFLGRVHELIHILRAVEG